MPGRARLFWEVSDLFERRFQGWEHSLVVWQATRNVNLGRDGVEVVASLRATPRARGVVPRAAVVVRIPGERGNERVQSFVREVERDLRARGYELLRNPQPDGLLAVREIAGPGLRAEHHFLSALTRKQVAPLRAGRLGTMRRFSASVSATGHAWRLHRAEWRTALPLRVLGRSAEANVKATICPLGSRTSKLVASVGLWVQLPWNGRGRRPAWVATARELLIRQLRPTGLRIDTFRRTAWPGAEGAIAVSGHSVLTAADVEREATQLAALHLGDAPVPRGHSRRR